MNENDMKINHLLMDEMGLEEGPKRRLFDQDTGIQYTMSGKDIVTPGSQSGKQSIEFDPINNPRMMRFMFSEYVNKLEDEESIPPVTSHYITTEPDKRMKAKILLGDNSIVESGAYTNETVCYADLVLRLNGEQDVDLSEYDYDRRKAQQSIIPKKLKPSANKKGVKKK